VDHYGHIALANCSKYWPRSGVRHVKRSLFALVGGLLGKAFPSNANDEPKLGHNVIQKTAQFRASPVSPAGVFGRSSAFLTLRVSTSK
jgi:hypothetical protein